MKIKKEFVALSEELMPIEGLEELGSEMVYVVGGNVPPPTPGSGCGCGCSTGSGCGCGCSTGSGCGCGC